MNNVSSSTTSSLGGSIDRMIFNSIKRNMELNEKRRFEELVEQGALQALDNDINKQAEYICEHTEVVFCNPRTKQKIQEMFWGTPANRIITSNAIPVGQVYIIGDEELRNQAETLVQGGKLCQSEKN